MGRKPIIRDAIRDVLKKADHPLRFNEIRERVAEYLGRSKEEVRDQNISDNLEKLSKNGELKVITIEGKKAYCISNSFYKLKNKTTIMSILERANADEFYPCFEDDNSPPLTAYFNNLENLISPLKRKGIQYFSTALNNWSNPVDLINRIMMDSYMDLDVEEKVGIARLLANAYWFGVQSLISEFGIAPLGEVLSRNRDFAFECIKNAQARKDIKRIEAEKAIIQILTIVEKILSKKTLKELLLFLQQQSFEIKKLQSKILLLTGQFMAAGEKIYDRFLEFHTCALLGFQAAKLIPEGRMKGRGFQRFRYLMSFSDVWDEFMDSIFEITDDEELASVNGTPEETLNRIKENEKFLWSLIALPFRSKMLVVYFWGYPEVFEVSDKEFLPMFADWMKALKSGYLDHRSWIFEKDSITTIIETLKSVKRGKIPKNGIIDLEPWTVTDLYYFHPRGKDADFWRELLSEINSRMERMPEKRELCGHISAVLEGGY